MSTEQANKDKGDLTQSELDTLKSLLEKLFRSTQNSNIKSHAKGIILKLVGLY